MKRMRNCLILKFIFQMNFGLSLPSLPILNHNFTEKTEELDNFLHRNSETLSLRDQVSFDWCNKLDVTLWLWQRTEWRTKSLTVLSWLQQPDFDLQNAIVLETTFQVPFHSHSKWHDPCGYRLVALHCCGLIYEVTAMKCWTYKEPYFLTAKVLWWPWIYQSL